MMKKLSSQNIATHQLRLIDGQLSKLQHWSKDLHQILDNN